MTKYIALLLKVALSVGLVWYAFHRIDFGTAWATLISIPWSAPAAALALMLVQLVLGAYRLRELLAQLGHRFRLLPILDTVFIGAFFSQTFISFVGGDAMRIWRVIRLQTPVAVATQGVILDRLAGFGGMVIVLLATIPFLVPMLESLEMRLGLMLIALAVLGLLFSVFVLRRLPDPIRSWRLIGVLSRFADHGLQIARSGRGAAFVLGLSVLIQTGNVLILYILARGLSVEVSLGQCFLFMPTVLFLSMLPISFAGWGVREGAMIAALAVIGVPAHQSLALSICFGLCLIFVSLPGGVVWFASRKKLLPAELNRA